MDCFTESKARQAEWRVLFHSRGASAKLKTRIGGFVLKSLTTSLVRLLLAALIAVLAWYGVYRLTTPQPHHACIPRLIEDAPYPSFMPQVSPHHFRFDSTGWWFAVGPSRFNATSSSMSWLVHHLKTGEVRSFEWDDTLDTSSWVPLEAGYRHTRRDKEGGIEVVDTSFVDGSSIVRLKFAKGHLADERLIFSHDGSRAVTTHRVPLLKLLALGSSPGLNLGEAMAWTFENSVHPSLNTKLPTGFAGIGVPQEDPFVECIASPRLAHLWTLPEAKLKQTLLLPAFTDLNFLKLSPNGKWLVRLDAYPTMLAMHGHFRSNPSDTGARTFQLQPRGVLVFDTDTGQSHHILSPTVKEQEGYYQCHLTDAGMHLVVASIHSSAAQAYGSYAVNQTNVNESCPLFLFPDCQQKNWQHGVLTGFGTDSTLPVRTMDGLDVAFTLTGKPFGVASVTAQGEDFTVLHPSVPISMDTRAHLYPVAVPEQVLVAYEPSRAYQKVIDWFKQNLNYDIEKYLPDQQNVSACIVDVHKQSVVWRGSLTIPQDYASKRAPWCYDQRSGLATSPPKITPTWDRKAIWACHTLGMDLHVYRWELPLVSWSPAWSIGAGVLAFLGMMWMTRKRRPRVS